MMTEWRPRALALLLGTLCALAAGAASGEGFSGERPRLEADLLLRSALPGDPAKPDAAANLVLFLEARDGQWQRVWGKGYTIGEHEGIVEAAEVTDAAVHLTVRMLVHGDFWIQGDWPAVFDIALDRRSDGTLAGKFQGEFKGAACSGEASGRLLPPRPVREGFASPRLDEHPRLLFRKADIPRLREKLQTPFGQAFLGLVKESGDAISLGVLYQLTGERAYADRARQAIEADYKNKGDGKIPVFGFGSGGFGHDVFRVAVAYDLCLEAWPKDFNAWVRPQLEDFTERQQHVLMTSHANFHPCSNYYGPGRGVPGVVAMVLWGDKGAAPKEPRNPVARSWPVGPPKGYTPAPSVPVADLVPGQTPPRWIWTGLLPFECSRDVLTKAGGYAQARPQVGTTVPYTVKSGTWFKQATLKFEPLPEDLASEKGIDVGKAAGDGRASVTAYFTNVRVKDEQVLRPAAWPQGMRVFMSGVELEGDKFYRVLPGLHPMTVEFRAEKTAGLLAPCLVPVDAQADAGPAGLYRIQHALWERDHALWEKTGMDPARQLWLDRGWFQNYQHYRWGIGDGGFKAETGGYANISSWYPSVYASFYPNFFGRPASPYPDVALVMPRQIMQAVMPPGGKPAIVKLNSALSLNLQWMACDFPIIPDRYKPAALWVWNYLAGVTDAAKLPAAFGSGKARQSDLGLAQTFVNYPLDMKPVPPAEGMPLTWRADTFGFHVFRSGWQGGDEFVSQAFAKAAPVGGWNHPNAASFTIYGLGRAWTTAPESRNGVREQYSVVLLPEDTINQGSCGRVTHCETKADGSGSLTLDLGDVYAAPSPGLYDGMFVRRPERLKPSGIEGLRAFGFDYSGKCGAPALVVIVDKIAGGGKKMWTWQRPEGQMAIEGNGFTLRQADASMRATFVAPKGVTIDAPGPEAIQVGDPRQGFHGTVDRVKATGGDSFFVVLTFQRGDPPPVKVEGEGLDAAVRVGGRTVRFDGRRVLIGQ